MFGFLCGPNFSTYLAKYLGLQLLDCIVRSCLALQENIKPSSNVVVKVSVAQSCLTLCDSMECGPAGSPVHGILLARMLVCCHFLLQRIFPPRGQTWVCWIAGRFFTDWATEKPKGGYAILCFHKQWMRTLVAPHPQHHLFLSVFWISAILLDR